MTNATEILAKITAALESGKTVTIANPYHITKITPKTYAQFVAAGVKLFLADGPHLLIRAGKRYDSCIGCQIKIG